MWNLDDITVGDYLEDKPKTFNNDKDHDKMNAEKRKRLETAGWRFGDAADFLSMTPEEEAYVELKLHLADALEAKRKAKGLDKRQQVRREILGEESNASGEGRPHAAGKKE